MKSIVLVNSDRLIHVDDQDYDQVNRLRWRLTGRNSASAFNYYGANHGRLPIRLSCTVPQIIFNVDKDNLLFLPDRKLKPISFAYKNGNCLDNQRHNIVVKVFEPGTSYESIYYKNEKEFHLKIKSEFNKRHVDFVYEHEIEGAYVDFFVRNMLIECKIRTVRGDIQKLAGQLLYYRLYSVLPIVVLLPDDVSIRSDLLCMLPPNTRCAHERELSHIFS